MINQRCTTLDYNDKGMSKSGFVTNIQFLLSKNESVKRRTFLKFSLITSND